MEDIILFEKLSKLPENLKQEVADFIEFLLQKNKDNLPERKPVFGSANGAFTLSPDFNKPLDDFKDYM